MMKSLAERAWFGLCKALGRVLRAARYARVRVVRQGDGWEVRKSRGAIAPLLVWLGDLLFRVLDTGVRILPQAAWEERERLLNHRLRGTTVRVDADGTLGLPWLPGETLASLLEGVRLTPPVSAGAGAAPPGVPKPGNQDAGDPQTTRAIELAVVALAQFHRAGFTHGDAMAGNVVVDLATGVAQWIDFETAHDAGRSMLWRRADDVRALLATCLLHRPRGELAGTLHLILDGYGDEDVTRLVTASFEAVLRRPLAFHLGQAGMSFRRYREVARLLKERRGDRAVIVRVSLVTS